MNDRYYIKIIIRRIEKKLGWKRVSLWTDNEFKKLSLLIYEETSISISPQTLKRLFGKVKYKDDYTIQPATKDALARFLAYTDWDAFLKDQSHSFSGFSNFLSNRINDKRLKTGMVILLSVIIVVIISKYLIHLYDSRSVLLHAENVMGEVPHTVSIHLNMSKLRNKDLRIDFDQNEAEDLSKGELLDKNLKLINHCFESPGYYNITLLSRGKLLASTKVHVLSEGWRTY